MTFDQLSLLVMTLAAAVVLITASLEYAVIKLDRRVKQLEAALGTASKEAN